MTSGEGSARLHLSDGDLHLWRASLRQPRAVVDRLVATLSTGERARAERIGSIVQRGRFIAGRGILRDILSRYLAVEPRRIVLAYEEHGKPRLAGDLEGSGVSFNLSHAGDAAVYAITLGRAAGVDVESLQRRVRDREKVARRFFSPLEYETFAALPEAEKPLAFLRCWTLKEAFIKAIGAGMTRPLSSFDVFFLPGEPPALLATRPDPDEARGWSLHAFDLGPDHVAAVAVAGSGCRLTHLDWKAARLPVRRPYDRAP